MRNLCVLRTIYCKLLIIVSFRALIDEGGPVEALNRDFPPFPSATMKENKNKCSSLCRVGM